MRPLVLTQLRLRTTYHISTLSAVEICLECCFVPRWSDMLLLALLYEIVQEC